MTYRIAHSMGGIFLANARLAYTRCLRELAAGSVVRQGSNGYSFHAAEGVILSVVAVEAWVNEIIATECGFRTMTVDKRSLNGLPLVAKVELLPRLLWGRWLPREHPVLADFRHLVRVRNDLVHWKSEPHELGKGPGYLKHLGSVGVLLASPPTGTFDWPTVMLTAEMVRWSHNVVCRLIATFRELPEDGSAATWDYLREQATEITEAERDEYLRQLDAARDATSPA